MPVADKIIILRNEETGDLRVMSNNPGLQVQIEDSNLEDDAFLTQTEREYPYTVADEWDGGDDEDDSDDDEDEEDEDEDSDDEDEDDLNEDE